MQYRLARAGEVVAAGQRVLTILDLNDVYMTIYLPAAVAGKLTLGEEARVILDPDPQYVLARNDQLRRHGGAVHAEERRDGGGAGEADVPGQAARRSRRCSINTIAQVKTGVRGLGFVHTDPKVPWPAELTVKLPQ